MTLFYRFIDQSSIIKRAVKVYIFELKAKRSEKSHQEDFLDVDYTEGSSKGGGKKKGKKGKKVSPSVLGFNVVSNRIMMGEIQSVED